MRIENPLSALYRGTEYFSLARTFRTVWGRQPAGTSLIGAAESERYSSTSERDAPSERETPSERDAPSERESPSERDAPSERESPSERDADAADYEAGHADAEFNEAAYPLAAGLDADCSCLKREERGVVRALGTFLVVVHEHDTG